jgi:hypothetical protein
MNRLVAPCGSDSAAQSLPKPPDPSLHTPSFDTLPSVLTPAHQNLQQDSSALCCNTCSFQISTVQPSPIAANTFALKETSFPLRSVNINGSDGELGHINCQSSSTMPRARHSLLKEFNLASLSELTPRKEIV